MNTSLNIESNITYREILLVAFPEELKEDVLVVLDTLPLDINTVTVYNNEGVAGSSLIHRSKYAVRFNNDILSISYRIYFNEPDPIAVRKLTETQRKILNCIYLKHHNGYIRQHQLEALAGLNEDWLIPHTLDLLGDYVLEILQILDRVITDDNILYYRAFIKDNPKYWQRIVSRMTSYWNRYYRWDGVGNRKGAFPDFANYPGKQIVERLNYEV